MRNVRGEMDHDHRLCGDMAHTQTLWQPPEILGPFRGLTHKITSGTAEGFEARVALCGTGVPAATE
ncbi:hypothetical protein GCM10012286_74460 [Streptomyces lasiicapitis]|uniref:Uncharacterized protein n=1 Tax=Streptomyces lasiicapitis TaxID=1923961 RepID=A0ABQ2MRY5_9ACTN|nr:hypothetical protein GCM10012286_74460 [Streptomyces lasiicapitis]